MITIRPSHTRGRSHRDWMDCRHSFSFAEYFDPAHTGYSVLRAVNEARLAPGAGFPRHTHRDMEIISYVLEGALSHEDDFGNVSVAQQGEIQVMSAGSGITHSECNASKSQPVHFLQIWLQPDGRGERPSYGRLRPEGPEGDALQQVVSRDEPETLHIHQDATVYLGRTGSGKEARLNFRPGRKGFIQVMSGTLRMKGQVLVSGDGAAVEDEGELAITSEEEALFFLFDLP